MAALASVADLEKRLRLEVGSLAGADLVAAELALEDASVLVLAEGNPDWGALTVPAAAKRVVIGVALRQYRNPDGLSTESMGGGAYSYRYADDETSAYLTEAEALIVQRAAAAEQETKTGFTGTVRTPSSYADPEPLGTVPETWPRFWAW